MTLREYITENMEHFVNSICNLSSCYCCALGNTEDCVLKRCGMSRFALDEELTEEEEKYLRNDKERYVNCARGVQEPTLLQEEGRRQANEQSF